MKTIFASILLLGACSSDPLDPGAGSDPGGGTNTLLVDGHATAEPRFANAKLETDFDTEFSVRVTLNNNEVIRAVNAFLDEFGAQFELNMGSDTGRRADQAAERSAA